MQGSDFREQLKGIRGFLLDMDGTFYLGDHLLEGSLSFLQKLAETGRQALFLTNNSSKSGACYLRKLEKMGVPKAFQKVLTSGQAAGSYLLSRFGNKPGFLLGNPMLLEELSQMGLSLGGNNPEYVLVGYDTTLDYAKMTVVCDLVRSGLPYIATHPDFNCPTEHGYAPDIGAIIAFIEASTGRKPNEIIGKPNGGIVREALALMGLPTKALAMVGDRLYTDIATGVNFGMTSILVLTGEAGLADVKVSTIQPDMIFNRLSDMNEYL